MVIRTYEDNDEKGWLRCRVLSFLDTAYFDEVRREKENYAHPSVELIAEEDNQIIGIMDIECEQEPNTICSNENISSGMIWHIAVHPDFQRKGVATALLDKAIKYLRDIGIHRIEAWTRDDRWVNSWYESNHFIKKDAYFHVYTEGKEVESTLESEVLQLRPVSACAHYTGNNEEILNRFNRVHECSMYELILNHEQRNNH